MSDPDIGGLGDGGPISDGTAGGRPATGGTGPALTGQPVGPPLARSMLDRSAHRRTDQEWLSEAWQRAQVLVVDMAAGGNALATGSDEPVLVLLSPDEVPSHEDDRRLFLGEEPDGTPIFAVDVPLPALPNTSPVTLRTVGHLLTAHDAGMLTTAVALANWHARHPYSSMTGRPTRVSEGGWSRVDDEGDQVWPRTDPAMIVLVNDGDRGPDGRCLLGNNAAWRDDRVRRFSCLAGFVEPGESAEAAVVREVDEEVGLSIGAITYGGSQAWPFPGSLMLGFFAVADPDQPLRLDPAEIADARWFTRGEVAAVLAGETVDAGDGRRVGLPPPSSIAHYLINRWLAGPGGPAT